MQACGMALGARREHGRGKGVDMQAKISLDMV